MKSPLDACPDCHCRMKIVKLSPLTLRCPKCERETEFFTKRDSVEAQRSKIDEACLKRARRAVKRSLQR